MSSTPTRNMAQTPVPESYMRAQVASGHDPNASEVVWAGLRLPIERDQAASRPKLTEGDRQSR